MNLQYLPATSALIGEGKDAIDPANVKAGEQPPIPADEKTLLIEALRTINRMSGLLNEIAWWMHQEEEAREDRTKEAPSLDALCDLVCRRFSDGSGLHVFIAAGNLGIDLPPDIDGHTESGDEE